MYCVNSSGASNSCLRSLLPTAAVELVDHVLLELYLLLLNVLLS